MFEVVYKKKALKALDKMPKKMAGQFFNAFDRLAENNNESLDVKNLSGREGYRLRIGSYRAIYRVDGEQLIILVLDVSPRGGVYK